MPFVPGPAVAPVSLRPIQSSTSQAIPGSLPPSADVSPASLPAAAAAGALPGPSTAALVSRPPNASAGFIPAQTAPLSIVPNSAPAPAGFPHALGHLASVRSSPFQPLSGLLTTTQAASGGHSQLPLLPPTVPSSSSATAPGSLPLPLDTTAALVAAVGPLFEAFVAQAAAVVDRPDMPMQALVGQVTQDLAAAIAAAAMQVVDARRHQGLAVTAAVGVAAAEPLKLITAEASQAPATVAESAKVAHAPKVAPFTYDDALTKAVDTSQAGHAASGAAHADANFGAVSSPALSVVSLLQEPSAASRSAPSKEAKQSGSKHFTKGRRPVERNTVVASKPIGSQGKASQQAIVVEGKHRRDAGTRNDSNSPPSVSTLGLPAKEKKTKQPIKFCDTTHGQSKAGSGVVGAKNGVKDATKHKQTDSKKRSSNDTPGSAGERAAKRPHMLSSTPGGSLEYEGYVVPGLDISRYEKGKDKAQVDKGSRPSSASHQQGVRDVRPVRAGSPHSRSSKSSGRSSPKDFRPLSAASDSFNGSRRDSRSPREPSRLNVGSMMHDTARRDASAVPSRMAGRFGSASPVLSAVLPFEPAADVPLCHGFGAPDFRPVGGRQHGRDAGWQHVEAHHFDPLPLPDISSAPDFTPQFLPGGPAN